MLAACVLAACASPSIAETVDIETYWRHATRLGDDALAGRAPGTEGGAAAAAYIADQLRALGLEPPAATHSYTQPVPLHGAMPLDACRLVLSRPDTTVTLELWRDYLLYATGDETEVAAARPVIFAGYGIVAPEYDYDDYHSIDVEDAIVVFLEGEPRASDPWYFDGRFETHHAQVGVKQRLALSKGAAGSILLQSEETLGDASWARLQREFRFEHVTLGYGVPGNLSLIVSARGARELFAGSRHDLDETWAMDAEGTVESFPLETRLSFRGAFATRDFLSPNVVATVPGTDAALAASYVLISAHYDHLGVGTPVRGDSIYNGLIDNASGVAACLEMARVFSSTGGLRRSLLFVFLTAEETGLLGSRHYVENPLVPLHRTVANLNVDGIAFLDTFDDVVGVGARYSTLGASVEETARALSLHVSPVPEPLLNRDVFEQSDQLAFALAGIPSVLVQEGTDFRTLGPLTARRRLLEWGQDVYHTPFDDASQPIDLDAAREHLEVLLDLVRRVANANEAPTWYEDAPFALARMQSIAEGR